MQPYDCRVVILSNGFIYHNPIHAKERVAYRYDEIISMNIFLASYSSSIGSGCKIYYRYYVKGKKEYIISSPSIALMNYVRNYILLMHWMRLKDLLERREEVWFGDICVSKQYIKTKNSVDLFKLEEIKEIKLHLSSEDDAFQLEFNSGFRSKWAGGIAVGCDRVNNPHLFFKALEFVGIQLNLTQLPELGIHLNLSGDKA
ncbi:hypothetical protein HC928_07530 [bacterium]|nr:hypothetical protein [bacterium]